MAKRTSFAGSAGRNTVTVLERGTERERAKDETDAQWPNGRDLKKEGAGKRRRCRGYEATKGRVERE